jgi:hypothetical protein
MTETGDVEIFLGLANNHGARRGRKEKKVKFPRLLFFSLSRKLIFEIGIF